MTIGVEGGRVYPESEMDLIRLLQRESLLKKFDPRQNSIIHKLFPEDHFVSYGRGTLREDEVSIDNLLALFDPFEFDKGEGGYSLLFRLASTAQTPEELHNIFHAVRTIEQLENEPQYRSLFYNRVGIVRSSRDIFLNHKRTVRITDLSEKGNWLFGRIDESMEGGGPTEQMKWLGRNFFNPDSQYFQQYREALAEVCMFMILGTDIASDNYYWNEEFLYGTRFFSFEDGRKNIFDKSATFWKKVDGSWAGLDKMDDDVRILFKEEGETPEDPANFHKQRVVWYAEKLGLEAHVEELEAALANANERIERLVGEKVAGNQSWASNHKMEGTQGDAVDRFLAQFNITKEGIRRMRNEDRANVVSKLKRIAGAAWHPNGGLAPNEKRLQEINGFLSEFDPQKTNMDKR